MEILKVTEKDIKNLVIDKNKLIHLLIDYCKNHSIENEVLGKCWKDCIKRYIMKIIHLHTNLLVVGSTQFYSFSLEEDEVIEEIHNILSTELLSSFDLLISGQVVIDKSDESKLVVVKNTDDYVVLLKLEKDSDDMYEQVISVNKEIYNTNFKLSDEAPLW